MAIKHAVFKGYSGERELPKKKTNKYRKDGKSLVSQIKTTDAAKGVKTALKKIGGIKKVVKKGSSVLLKPNLVFAQPNPCTTSPDFLKAIINACFDAGAGRVVVGERAAFQHSTRKIAQELGVEQMVKKTGADIAYFDEGKWYSVNLNLPHVKKVTLPEEVWKHDALINIPCLKTHRLARFTMSLKNTIGLIHPMEMPTLMFLGHLESKIAEINTAVFPDLIIMDGRKCFITEGPQSGEVAKPGLIFASGDRIANDVAGLKVLMSYKARNRLEYDNPFDYIQIKHAAELGVGAKSEKQIRIINS